MAVKLIETKEIAKTKDESSESFLVSAFDSERDELDYQDKSSGILEALDAMIGDSEISDRMRDVMKKATMPATKASNLSRQFAQDLSKFGISSDASVGQGKGSDSGQQSKGQGQGQGGSGDDSIFDLLAELAASMYAEVDAVYGKNGKDCSIEMHTQLMKAVEEGIKKLAQVVASQIEKSSSDSVKAQEEAQKASKSGQDQIQQMMKAVQEQMLQDAVASEKRIQSLADKAAGEAAIAAKKAAEEALPKQVTITLPDLKKIQMESSVADNFEKGLRILNALQIVWLCGPAGSGKTMMAGQFAKALDLPFYAISCTAGISESWFIGRRDINGEYISPEFLNLYENGGVILLDEFDAADPNTGLIVNAAIGNGYLTVPLRTGAPLAKRHPKFYVVFATNTWGFGVDGQYTGREGMDASTRDRAVLGKVHVSYSHTIESKFLPDVRNEGYDVKVFKVPEIKQGLGNALNKVRDNIRTHNLKRIVSTRAFEQASILKNAGFSDQEILSIYFVDWSPNELAKGVAGIV